MKFRIPVSKHSLVIGCAALLAVFVAAPLAYVKVKQRRARAAARAAQVAPVLPSLSATAPLTVPTLPVATLESHVATVPGASLESHVAYVSETRRQMRFCLDVPPEEWSAPRFTGEFKDVGPLPFSADDIPPPTDTSPAWDLIRPAPYPYHRTLAIPSDCCGTLASDLFYTQTLLSRRYGLDTGSSFWPYTTGGHEGGWEPGTGGVFSLFWQGQKSFRTLPVRLETEDVDAFPLFLCYYYRGWVDHIHSWSTELTSGHSLTGKTAHTFDSDEEMSIDLEIYGGVNTGFEGLEIGVALSDAADWFELTLTDQSGLPHHVVYRRELDGRQGWDLSDLPREELRSVCLKLSEERNRKHLRTLGSPSESGFPLKSATLKAGGKKGGTVECLGVRVFELSRETIARQMAQMGQYNLLPSAASHHGGNASWTAILPFSCVSQVPSQSGAVHEQSRELPPQGLTPGTPAYHGDLLRDFGVDFLFGFMAPPTPPGKLGTLKAADGKTWYLLKSQTFKTPRIPEVDEQLSHFQNLGAKVASYLNVAPEFGDARALYTHYNFYNGTAFQPAQPRILYMNHVKRLHPQTEQALAVLANAQYNLDGRRQDHQRVWVCPVSVLLRYLQVRDSLTGHARLEGSVVHVAPWKDPITGRQVPDPDFPSQDLHGQTFYVPDARIARVFLGDIELKGLKRNPPDGTGRSSVTVIDVSTPTLIFDEIDLAEQTGRIVPEGGCYFFRSGPAYVGRHALEVQASRSGTGKIHWEPLQLTSHETGFIRFAYRKTNPKARAFVSWTLADGTETVASEGELAGRQGWQLPVVEDTEYHEVVLDYADLQSATGAAKRLPRGEVRRVTFGLEGGTAGDGILFDRVEFLSARGVRPHRGQGLVIGGRLYPNQDGETVTLTLEDGQQLRTTTTRGGWFLFQGVPAGSVAELAYEKDRVQYFPLRGRLIQAVKNDVEYHIHATDPRSPFVPRPRGFVGLPVTEAMAPKSVGPDEQVQREYDPLYQPHSTRFFAGFVGRKRNYLVEEHVNNYGRVDKDRRFDNPDGTLRIVLLGDCWPDGLQTPIQQHVNILLESMLRRRFGVPVEVIISGSSSSSPASFSLWFEKYGSRFNPDLVLLFLNPMIMAHVEPSMLKEMVGWDKDHSAYKMYDFDEKGNLVGYAPDPQYVAFQGAADKRPLLGDVPLVQSFAVAGWDHPTLHRSFDLLRGILKEQYISRQGGKASRVGLIYGYDSFSPSYGTRHGVFAVAEERWRNRVADLCEELGLLGLDLASRVPKSHYVDKMLWEDDFHLTGTGHHVLARALAEELSQRPEFRALVERRKASLAREQTSPAR